MQKRNRSTTQRTRKKQNEAKAPSTQASEFVGEEIRAINPRSRRKGTPKSRRQAIAIGLSKARKSGIRIPEARRAKAKSRTRKTTAHKPVRRKSHPVLSRIKHAVRTAAGQR